VHWGTMTSRWRRCGTAGLTSPASSSRASEMAISVRLTSIWWMFFVISSASSRGASRPTCWRTASTMTASTLAPARG
jgi:hypothetical protein